MKDKLQCWTCNNILTNPQHRPCGDSKCERVIQTIKTPSTIIAPCVEGKTIDGKFWAECCVCNALVSWANQWESWHGTCPKCKNKGLQTSTLDLDLL